MLDRKGWNMPIPIAFSGNQEGGLGFVHVPVFLEGVEPCSW